MPTDLAAIRERHRKDPYGDYCSEDEMPWGEAGCDTAQVLAEKGGIDWDRMARALDLCGIGEISGHIPSTWIEAIAAEYAVLADTGSGVTPSTRTGGGTTE